MASPEASTPPLLDVRHLSVQFRSRRGTVQAVDDVSLHVAPGETLAIVGESGCGKSVTALSLLRLIAEPVGKITSGEILYGGRDLMGLSERQMRSVRGNDIAMIFQEPMTSLNPVMTIGRQIGEAVALHEAVSRDAASHRAVEMLELVQIPDAARRLTQYPYELSGGMRQRVMIAMALANDPKLLIADEPTTALDVTIQAQILDIIRSLRRRLGMATILITHDLGVVAEMAQRVMVMYAGRKVEEASVRDLLRGPRHPYTLGLIGAVPKLGSSAAGGAPAALAEISGTVPSLAKPSVGCAFAPRCPLAVDQCRRESPPLADVDVGHLAACWRSAEVGVGQDMPRGTTP